ncbi:hypothetical protein ACFP1Z_11315 [Streptomyces gamaensis]|uniref:Uncharacterized protein n=1 Tax=Streptomyces gamaensis TaxID=1763542 RepID=A0ABW0Z136_9ACTN
MPGVDGLRVLPTQRPRERAAALRLVDARTGEAAGAEPGHRRPLRILVDAPYDGAEQPSGLRARLVADVLARATELYGGQALVGCTWPVTTGRSDTERDAFEAQAAVLGIRPPAAAGTPEEVSAALGGPADVHITTRREAVARGLLVEIGTVVPYERPGPLGLDALALRLALLDHPHRQPVSLTPEGLGTAERSIVRWRRSMAAWAQAPSKPMCAEYLGQALARLEDDLDVPGVLAVLDRVEADDALPAGSKFETFAHLDRVLALELAREIGRETGRPAPPGTRS